MLMKQSLKLNIKQHIEFTIHLKLFCSFLVTIILGFPAISLAQNDMTKRQNKAILQAGIAYKNITPNPKIKNWVTGVPYSGVRDSIYTRALVLSSGDQKVVLIQWDLVDAGESATARVRAKVSEALNIPEYNILVNASHNHSAPWAPVYGDEHRGEERDTWWAVRYMPPQHEDPYYKQWMQDLVDAAVAAAESADKSLEPSSVWIGRADVSEYLRNRRPRPVGEGIREDHMPDDFNYRHDDWDPAILSGARTFGPMDRAMTFISFRNQSGENVGNLFHLSCHAVSIYPFMDAVSGDWPAATIRRINEELGAPSIFLQGTAGDINPWRRGAAAVEEMAEVLTGYARKAYRYSARLEPGQLNTDRTVVGLPLTDYGKERTGLESMPAEIQAVTYGSLAMVTLPGEPMTELGMEIRKRSPYPQTLVLGYSNGNGVHYVGMPGEKKHGGYEVGEKTNLGTDRAGLIMVEAAEDLLHKMYEKNNHENGNEKE